VARIYAQGPPAAFVVLNCAASAVVWLLIGLLSRWARGA